MSGLKYLIPVIFSIVLLSGCVSQPETPGTTEETGKFVLLISDAPADIADFDSLLVTFSKARIFTPGEPGGFEEFNFTATVDITQLVDEKSIEVLEIELEEGTYSKIELYASEIKGWVGAEEVQVTIPGEKLQLVKPFEVKSGEETKFVFDINVVKKGQGEEYNLLPVIGKSGTVGKELKKEEIEKEECTIDADCGEDEFCSEGECEKLEEKTECEEDSDCGEGEICVYNVCKESVNLSMSGDFVLLVSDKEADISDFESLVVSFSKARVFKTGETGGFEEFSIEGTSVDLTEVIGEKAITVLNVDLSEGWYNKVELHVSGINATTNGGNAVVRVPSNRLQIIRPFEIKAGEETKFVFDIHVVRRGRTNEYNIRPVIGKSGIVGKDMDHDDVNETECTVDADCGEGEVCMEGECVEAEEPECIDDSDCPENQTCVNETCVDVIPEPECINDTDCPENQTCVNETCVDVIPEPECAVNETRACYTGPAETRDVGECSDGTETCIDEEWSGVCEGETTPANETCDGLDDDCDGTVDEDFPELGQPCDGPDSDLCMNGAYTCTADGTGVECVNESPADIQEVCDEVDNDCDGETDEGC